AKSAMSTQLFAPHNVAANDTNSIAARSCRALMSRGSRTSRKIVISVSIQGLPHNKGSPFRIHFHPQRNRWLLICDSPALAGEGWGGGCGWSLPTIESVAPPPPRPAPVKGAGDLRRTRSLALQAGEGRREQDPYAIALPQGGRGTFCVEARASV